MVIWVLLEHKVRTDNIFIKEYVAFQQPDT